MHFVETNGRRYAQFERLRQQTGLVHAFCTRPTDVSPRPDSQQAERTARRAQMASDFGLDADRLLHCVQIHDTHIEIIDTPRTGGPLEGTDGVATDLPSTPLMTFSADCPLVLAYDPVRGALGMVHASWRCTVALATQRLLSALQKHFGCVPTDMHAGIGPGAGPCCYEVREDVYEAAADLPERASLFASRDGRLYFDLWSANREQLLRAGLRAESIETAGICTLCRNDLFYSYRREGTGCGHFGLMAALRAGGRGS